ncbi:MAG: c-type cytochrome [Rhizobacter sp.]
MKTMTLCLLALAAPFALAQDAKSLSPRVLAASCSACHGTDGHAIAGAAVPGLAGVPAAQISERLKAFQRGEAPSTVMQQIAKGYTDAQIDTLATWFAAQKP